MTLSSRPTSSRRARDRPGAGGARALAEGVGASSARSRRMPSSSPLREIGSRSHGSPSPDASRRDKRRGQARARASRAEPSPSPSPSRAEPSRARWDADELPKWAAQRRGSTQGPHDGAAPGPAQACAARGLVAQAGTGGGRDAAQAHSSRARAARALRAAAGRAVAPQILMAEEGRSRHEPPSIRLSQAPTPAEARLTCSSCRDPRGGCEAREPPHTAGPTLGHPDPPSQVELRTSLRSSLSQRAPASRCAASRVQWTARYLPRRP